MIRVIEAPPDGATGIVAQSADAPARAAELPPPAFDEEPDEDLAARIRQA